MKVTLNVQPLRDLMAKLPEVEKTRAQVGLFADTAGRSADRGRISDNPSLGFQHEFGNPDTNLPERSFLRMPLSTQLAPALAGKNWAASIKTRGVKRTVALLGAIAEDVVQEGFATKGFGAWPEIKPATARRKGSTAVLIESAQMRKAVSSRVVTT